MNNKSDELINLNDHIESSNGDKYFSNKSILIVSTILIAAIIFSLLIICLVKFFS